MGLGSTLKKLHKKTRSVRSGLGVMTAVEQGKLTREAFADAGMGRGPGSGRATEAGGTLGAIFRKRQLGQNVARELTKSPVEMWRGVRDYMNPEMPETRSSAATAADTSLMMALAEDAARRRRGLAGRSLLRTSFGNLGGANTGASGSLGRSG